MRCLECDKELLNPKHLYCSNKCKKKYLYRTKVTKQTCKRCNKEFEAAGIKQYCSEECRHQPKNPKLTKCLVCNKEFLGYTNKLYCSIDCYLKSKSKAKGITTKVCAWCYSDFRALKNDTRAVCSDECEKLQEEHIKQLFMDIILGREQVEK